MENIFEIQFSFEQQVKENVISVFSTKQGGDYNVFGFHWQCFVWAAVVGFLYNEKRPLTPPIANKVFSLKTMINNGGEKCAQALICMCIAKNGSIDIMKNPQDAINLINEYANGGFYHIMNDIKGEQISNDFDYVKREIFGREFDSDNSKHKEEIVKEEIIPEVSPVETITEEAVGEKPQTYSKKGRWTTTQLGDLKRFYLQGMDMKALALYFNRTIDDIKEKLEELDL